MNKKEILSLLGEEFQRWEELLSSMSEEQITSPSLPFRMSIKDMIAHLAVWLQRSIERLEAPLQGREPVYTGWPENLNPEAEETIDLINLWIYESRRESPWESVYQEWRVGFVQFLQLGERIAEADLQEKRKDAWLEEYTPADVLLGAYEHHHDDHLLPLQAWLSQAQH